MELDYWPSTTCKSSSFDEAKGEWTVVVERDGKQVTLTPKQLVIATGMSGFPEIPNFPGAELFKGKQHHSSHHRGGEGWAGKKCVVVGSNNSAHDIAADLWEHGADVTMVQRSPTLVVRAETLARTGRSIRSRPWPTGITTEIADLIHGLAALRALPEVMQPALEQMARATPISMRALEKAGFKLTFGEDNRASARCICAAARATTSTSALGARSSTAHQAQVRRRGEEHLTEDSVVLNDGTELPADLVVYATGYGSMNQWAAELISPEVADKVGKCWGLGSGPPRTPAPGRASCATCGSRRRRKRCGSMAATCTSRATIRSSCRCSSRRAWRGCRRRSTTARPYTTRREIGWGRRAVSRRRLKTHAPPPKSSYPPARRIGLLVQHG
jgi:putative flavoprotein involved in K+ transport